MFTIIVAATRSSGIGLKNELPWRLSQEMVHFRRTTIGENPGTKPNVLIMGRLTWESLPPKFRPLPQRLNVVIGKQPLTTAEKPYIHCLTLSEALQSLPSHAGNIFVIGGSGLYTEAVTHPKCSRLLITRIESDFECDRFFPAAWGPGFGLTSTSSPFTEPNLRDPQKSDVTYRHETYDRVVQMPIFSDTKSLGDAKSVQLPNLEERQYLDTIADVLKTGTKKEDRTGTGTISKFGHLMHFSLRDGRFPLLTTKRVPFKAVAEELFWMLRGSTDAKELSAKKVTIWDANGSRAALDKLGFRHREEGDLGPVYGHQWRFFGSKYTTCKADYKGQGVDQIADVIRLIKTDPNSRRIFLSSWNPVDLKQMALPPCHVSVQFTVRDGFLNSMLYQRSCDMGLGIPFNIASYSLLTILIADFCGLKPGEFVHTLGDYHIYLDHVEALTEQLARIPRPFPTLRVKQGSSPRKDICEYSLEDLILEGYDPHPPLKMSMSV
jgi:dihydrofolate reductase/thymidylate synthase